MPETTEPNGPTDPGSESSQPTPKRGLIAFLPVILFFGLAAALFYGLQAGDPSKLPSALVGQTAPQFTMDPLEGLVDTQGAAIPGLSAADLAKGKVSIVNVWASWCGPCRQEHPVLMQLSQEPGAQVVGLNYKDQAENARRFLGVLGNPFSAVGIDPLGRTSINWGVYGVPETFVIDGKGIIRLKHVGPLSPADLENKILPAIAAANKAGS